MKDVITRKLARTNLVLSKNSPQLLLAAGIATGVATVVVACRATIKAQKVKERQQEVVDLADSQMERGLLQHEEHKKVVVGATKQSLIEYSKLYGPAFVLGVTSIACLTKSHNILTTRNAGLAAAYAGVDKAFKAYRAQVVDEFGAEKDTQLAHGVAEREVVEYDDKGNAVVVAAKTGDPNNSNPYTIFFDESNRFWEKDHGYNHTFLDSQMRWANVLLKRRGHLFLNEVYELIGFPHTKVGAQVGWVYENREGDGYIDFGFNRYPDFVAGYERSVLLEFNVDGNILDLI